MKKIPFAVVGLNFGKYVLEELALQANAARFRVAAVCDLDGAKAEATGKLWKVPSYDNLDTLLRNRDIPAVGLFTGPGGRAGLLGRALRAGKDVMTTKPFEDDPTAAAAVLREAARRGRIVHVNSPSPRPAPDLARIALWRRSYSLGRLVGARGEIWVRYAEKRDGSWYDDPSRCPTAPIFRLGIYLINDLVGLCGPAAEVQVLQSRISTGRPTPDNAQLGIRFRDGTLANVYASFCVDDAHAYRNGLTLNFERGTVYRNVGPLGTPAPAVELALAAAGEKIERKTVVVGSGAYDWASFHRAILRRELPGPAYARQVVNGIKVVEAMRRAAASGLPAVVR